MSVSQESYAPAVGLLVCKGFPALSRGSPSWCVAGFATCAVVSARRMLDVHVSPGVLHLCSRLSVDCGRARATLLCAGVRRPGTWTETRLAPRLLVGLPER